jgi:enduracididine beta-hydroxylase
MEKITLEPQEIHQLTELLRDLTDRYSSVEDPELLCELDLAAHQLPRRLRQALLDFRRREPSSGVCVISGFPIDAEKIGPTPAGWSQRATPPPTLAEEMYLLLLGALLGESIAWATQQGGHLVHDILPVPGCEHEQLGLGSEELLWWHTEDAFHPYRGDYLGMLCLRNPDRVATTVGTLANVELTPRQRELLFEPHFTIKPDESHLPKNRALDGVDDFGLDASYARIEERAQKPERVPVLFGARESPYMRLDPFFMERLEDDAEAQAALDALVRSIDANLVDLALAPGEVCFIDNYRAVHGRKPFRARYDGNDRWLKRINITRDLRKSRDARAACDSRTVI